MDNETKMLKASINELGAALAEIAEAIENRPDQAAALAAVLKDLVKATKDDSRIAEAIRAVRVNVAAPTVNVAAPTVQNNIEPVVQIIEKHTPSKWIMKHEYDMYDRVVSTHISPVGANDE